MWKAAVGTNINPLVSSQDDDDDWDTDPNYVNNVTEEEQRWGGGRTVGAIDMNALREQTAQEDLELKKKNLSKGPQASYGYGGKFGVEKDRMDKSALSHEHIEHVEKHSSQKDYSTGFGGKFGVQKDRMDKSAVGHDYIAKVEKHASQTDCAKGFGGKFGVQTDRIDKSAVGWDYQEKLVKHESQTDGTKGFGGKFGVQTDRIDKSAVGWDHQEKLEKHESQTDGKKGFGGKFGVQKDRIDKSAVGWDYHDKVEKHESQKDYTKGFGGKFGVQTDRQDASAVGFDHATGYVGTNYEKNKPVVTEIGKASQLKSRFESLADGNKQTTQTGSAPRKVCPLPKMIARFEPEAQSAQPAQPVPTVAATSSVPEKTCDPVPVAEPNVISQPETSDVVLRDHSTQPSAYQRLSLAESVEELEENGHTESWNDQPDEWNDQVDHLASSANPYIGQDTGNLETVAEEDGTNLVAIALYDYQAGADDELSFDPDDIITNIEMIDEGWWRGECKGMLGLFPANYVQLQQ